MKKHNKIIAAIATALLFVGIGTSVNQSQIVRADNSTVQGQQDSRFNAGDEDYNNITGHDASHPIWAHNSLGVIVENDDPTLLQAVQEACNNWSPLFIFHDYGYVNIPQGKEPDTEHGRLHFVYVREADLSQAVDRGDPHVHVAGRSIYPHQISPKVYFQDKAVTVLIDVNVFNNNLVRGSMSTAVTHEFGHILGLFKHSTNPSDVMYWIGGQNGLQPDELGAVRRLYQGIHPVSYPDQLNFVDPSQNQTNPTNQQHKTK